MPYTQTYSVNALHPFCYAGLLRLKVCAFSLLLSSPYLPFDSLKLLLLFVTFQTFTPTNVFCGSLHTFRACIGRCYANTAFSFLIPILVCYSAFITEAQCGLLSRLFTDLCALSLSLFRPCIVRGSALSGISPSLLAFRYSRLTGGSVCLCCTMFL